MSFSLNDSMAGPICGGLAGIALFFFSIFLFVKVTRERQKARASLNWPSVEGKITAQWVNRSEVHDEDGVHVSYIPKVVFEYTVEGLSFQGQRIAFGSEASFNSRKKAEAFLAGYPKDGAIMVYYNFDVPGCKGIDQRVLSLIRLG